MNNLTQYECIHTTHFIRTSSSLTKKSLFVPNGVVVIGLKNLHVSKWTTKVLYTKTELAHTDHTNTNNIYKEKYGKVQ